MLQVVFTFESIAEAIDTLGSVFGQADGAKKTKAKKGEEAKPNTAAVNTVNTDTSGTVDFDFSGGASDPLDFLSGTDEKKLTLEMVREKASNIAKQSDDKKNKVVALVKHHKVADLSSLPESSYQTFYDQLDKIK